MFFFHFLIYKNVYGMLVIEKLLFIMLWLTWKTAVLSLETECLWSTACEDFAYHYLSFVTCQ